MPQGRGRVKTTGISNERLQTILSFYVWQTRSLPRTRCLAWRGSCLPTVSACIQENLFEPLLVRTTPHFTASFTCHQTVTVILDPRFTWQLSPPDCKAYHLGIAVMLAPDVTQGISSWKADTWPIVTHFSSSFLRRNPHRSPSTWHSGSYIFCN